MSTDDVPCEGALACALNLNSAVSGLPSTGTPLTPQPQALVPTQAEKPGAPPPSDPGTGAPGSSGFSLDLKMPSFGNGDGEEKKPPEEEPKAEEGAAAATTTKPTVVLNKIGKKLLFDEDWLDAQRNSEESKSDRHKELIKGFLKYLDNNKKGDGDLVDETEHKRAARLYVSNFLKKYAIISAEKDFNFNPANVFYKMFLLFMNAATPPVEGSEVPPGEEGATPPAKGATPLAVEEGATPPAVEAQALASGEGATPPAEGEGATEVPPEGTKKTTGGGNTDKQPQTNGAAEQPPATEETSPANGAAEQPLATEETSPANGAAEQPLATEETSPANGATEEQPQTNGASEEQPQTNGAPTETSPPANGAAEPSPKPPVPFNANDYKFLMDNINIFTCPVKDITDDMISSIIIPAEETPPPEDKEKKGFFSKMKNAVVSKAKKLKRTASKLTGDMFDVINKDQAIIISVCVDDEDAIIKKYEDNFDKAASAVQDKLNIDISVNSCKSTIALLRGQNKKKGGAAEGEAPKQEGEKTPEGQGEAAPETKEGEAPPKQEGKKTETEGKKTETVCIKETTGAKPASPDLKEQIVACLVSTLKDIINDVKRTKGKDAELAQQEFDKRRAAAEGKTPAEGAPKPPAEGEAAPVAEQPPAEGEEPKPPAEEATAPVAEQPPAKGEEPKPPAEEATAPKKGGARATTVTMKFQGRAYKVRQCDNIHYIVTKNYGIIPLKRSKSSAYVVGS